MSSNLYPGLLVVISGPSGVGKTTICHALVDRLGAQLSVSATTRPAGSGEQNGEAYLFLSEQQFKQHLDDGDFLEHAQVFGYSYGTLTTPVVEALQAGQIVVLEIDVNGAKQIRQRFDWAKMFFILPPAPDILSDRLNTRQRDAQTVIAERLSKADGEIRFAQESGCYDYTIVNDNLEEAIKQVVTIINQVKEKS
jgi:guanylate kinase